MPWTFESSPLKAHLLASLRPERHSIPVLPALHRGDVIEIQGPALSGKTHLLYHILLSFLVPVSPPHAEIAVVVYDTDAAFDIERFRHLLLSRISRVPSSLDPQECVRRALTRLHLFRPSSLVQLAASIANLPAYHASHMTNQEIAVLAIDSISTFYWADRFSAEQLRDNVSRVPMTPSLHHVLDALQRVRCSHRPLAILTNWALNAAPSHSDLFYKQHLHLPVIEHGITDLRAKVISTDHSSSSPFRLAHHISLSSPSSVPLAASPLDIALLRDPRHNQDIVDNGRVLCLTRSSGTQDILRFTLQITDDDVLVHQATD